MGSRHYRRHLGTARASLRRLVAGSTVNLRLVYRAGRFGVDDSGGLMVVARFSSDAAPLQFEDPRAPNYVRISSSNPEVRFLPRYGPKIHRRPWGRGLEVKLTGGYLAPGEEVRFDFRRWRAQTFCEKSYELRVLVDPFATCEYVELPRSPEIEVVPGPAARLVLVAPSQVRVGERFALGLKLEDEWGNPCRQLASAVRLEAGGAVRGLPRRVKLRRGAARVGGLRAAGEGVLSIEAGCGRLRAASNPVRAVGAAELGRYWADFHAQSGETIGTGTVEEYLAFARDYAFLDVVSHQGNDFQITGDFWKRLNAATRRFNREGRFAAFPGFEWSGNTGLGGDRNVIFMKEGGPLSRSSHALVEDLSDVETDSSSADGLFKRMKKEKAVVFAHVGGRYADMDFHDDAVERAVEVHSAWGTFEWLLFDALERGARVGVVAGSDDHKCRPGASYPGGKFGSYGGLTCVLAAKLTRRAVFEALRARRVYGTTGARIGLDVELLAGGRARAVMGEAVKAGAGLRLRVRALGTAPIERVEVYDGARRIATHYPELPGARRAVKVLWAGSECRGRARAIEWDGKLRLRGARVRRFEAVNFLSPESRVERLGPRGLHWQGLTTGGVQGVILHLEGLAGSIAFRTARKSVDVEVARLTRRPRVFRAGGLDARVEAYLTSAGPAPGEAEFEIPLKKLRPGEHPLFAKVVQRDGHMAWSSPIYVRA